MNLISARIHFRCVKCGHDMDSYYLYFKVGHHYNYMVSKLCEKCKGKAEIVSVRGRSG